MKLTKIRKLCMEAKCIHLTHGPGGADWIGDGRQYFRMVGVKVERVALGDLMGLSAKQEDKTITVEDNRREELFGDGYNMIGEQMTYMGMVIWAGVTLWVFACSSGAVYVADDAIAGTRADEAGAEFTLVRDRDGEALVAVRTGLFCDALLSPVTPDIGEMIRREMDNMARLPVMGYDERGGRRGAGKHRVNTCSERERMGTATAKTGAAPMGLGSESSI